MTRAEEHATKVERVRHWLRERGGLRLSWPSTVTLSLRRHDVGAPRPYVA
jgi:hypothetical protein